jgi:N-ethylmaleimide reductase
VKKLLTPYSGKLLQLKNHLVMAPMTRSRAIDNIPNSLMATYYGQRTGAGLIITEGTAVLPESLGYARLPGIFKEEHIRGWQQVTARVHKDNTRIFVQLMHTGRIGHVDNLPPGVKLVGVSGKTAVGQMYTDTAGWQDHSQPEALSTEGVYAVIEGHVQAARNAVKAGFDGIELHGANGYLVEQFLHPEINDRTDAFGGSMENRCRFVLEMAEQTVKAIGREKVGIRLSPFAALGDLPPYAAEDVHQTYMYLAEKLNSLGIAYIHIALSPGIPMQTLKGIRSVFKETIIFCNNLTPVSAEKILAEGDADLVAFARLFVANPDLALRIQNDLALSEADTSRHYTPGARGYTDYPVWTRN